ncbi:hypothetical protein [Streptomyces sp. NPDC091383]|uniref:hypothetical protein n=1 Tax=Streptomyces sp. NPDC091383 TaxID=3365996 RepID=UPI003825B83B
MTAQPEQEPTGAPQPDPVPRDMPDQQARSDDPLDLPGDRPADGPTDRPASENPGGRPDEADRDDRDDGNGLPDTDEAGTGPRGAPRAATVHPEHPGPDESPD